jgi:hypothetical protein
MKAPTAWLISKNGEQDEQYIQLVYPIVDSNVHTVTPLYSRPTAMQSSGLERIEWRFDLDTLSGNLVLWQDLTVEEKRFLVNQK